MLRAKTREERKDLKQRQARRADQPESRSAG